MRTDAKSPVLKRLQRIEGQVRGLARMVGEDRYCIDVVTQISAVRAALRRVEEEILKDHVAHCVEHAIASGNKTEQRRKVVELMDVLVGVIDVATDQVETPEEVAATIGEVMQHVPKERIVACTNCGMAPMRRDVALAKLDALGRGAALARERFG